MKTLFSKSMVTYAALCLALVGSALAAPAWALDVSEVSYAPQKQAGAAKLVLNGAGVRRMGDKDLYTAALYLEQKTTVPGVVIADKGAKQLVVTLLRDVNSRQISELLARGLTSNSSDDELVEIIPEIMDLGSLIAKQGKLKAGDSFQIDWNATGGTTITITVRERSQPKPTVEVFAKPDLISAMMRIWLGARPADEKLKSALLGQGA
ncbi:MAG: hypothetical protein CFE43_12910 [Burkholderiales bacterium PBB3]|nr:MAG: hypothetical protein CFE43_12910 [Burkholderiales bacterium PBB3]